MTMLDRMRRHRHWLKWTLGLVVLAFIFLDVPNFLGSDTGAAPDSEVVAQVGPQEITTASFRRAYQSQMQQYRAAYGGQMNDDLLRQLGIDRRILQQLIEERLAAVEAERLGIRVTDQELAQHIVSMPVFQENGAFIGEQRYEQLLRFQRPPMSKREFETNMRRALLAEKLREALTGWVHVSDDEIDRVFRERNEKAKLQLAVLPADKYRSEVTATDADLASYFEGRKEEYRIPEKRKIRYMLIDIEALRSKISVSDADIERSYQQNKEQYTTPAQVRASHILLKTEGKDEEAVRKQAEAVLKQVQAGGDFAALARKYSEDEASAKEGGDLDYFGRGRMVKEFEEAAFSLEPGGVSELVKSPFGYHIIKVTDKRPEVVQPLAEVKPQIEEQLKYERAQARATQIAEELDAEIDSPADLDRVAKARGYTVQETGLFGREEPIAGLGPAPEVTQEAFTTDQGKVAGPLHTARGHVFYTVTGAQDAYVPKLEEVKERVREDYVREKARELAKSKAGELAASFRDDFARAAKSAGIEPKTTELVARGAPLPEVGASPAVEEAAFALEAGATAGPIVTDNGIVFVKVLEKQTPKPDEITAGRQTLRDELLQERRNRFYTSYMAKARERVQVTVNDEALARIVGRAS